VNNSLWIAVISFLFASLTTIDNDNHDHFGVGQQLEVVGSRAALALS
jgi:hypothetical protein